VVDDFSGVDDGEGAIDAEARDAGIPRDFDELCAEGVPGKLV